LGLREGVQRTLRGGIVVGLWSDAVEEFRSIFAALEDPRTGNARRHDLHEIVLIALCTILCGG
jgi:hypothetical protein